MNGPLRHVLLGTDFTPGSTRAARRAMRLPLARGAEVELFHAAPRTAGANLEAEVRRLALEALEREAAWLRRAPAAVAGGVRIRVTLGSGEPAVALLRASRARHSDLVVAGAHGRAGMPDLDLGSTAEHLIQHGECPVLVVHREARSPYRHALVASDLAGSERRALAVAARWMAASGGHISLVHALEFPPEAALRLGGTTRDELERWWARYEAEVGRALDAKARAVEKRGLEVEPILARGDPRTVVARAARRLHADLVVLGSRPARDRTGLLLASVARHLGRQAPCDVLVVRPAARLARRTMRPRGAASRPRAAAGIVPTAPAS